MVPHPEVVTPYQNLSDRYRDVEILAPMVRACTLPLRRLTANYGADLVYSEEIIDQKIYSSKRVWDPYFNTWDYISQRDNSLVFQTAEEEKPKLIFQMGTNSGPGAQKAAMALLQDVAGFDVNMGCPKSFSIKGGMGSALLKKPEVAVDILKTLRRTVPETMPVTCKVRLICDTQQPTEEELQDATKRTSEFIKGCSDAGACAVALHTRTIPMRPRNPAIWPTFAQVQRLCPDVLLIPNGDFFDRKAIEAFRALMDQTGVPWSNSFMIARGGLYNPQMFDKTGASMLLPKRQVLQEYMRLATQYGSPYQNTKWVLAQLLTNDTMYEGQPVKVIQQTISRCKSHEALCNALGVADFDKEAYHPKAHTVNFYKEVIAPLSTEEPAKSKRPLESTVDGDELQLKQGKRPKPGGPEVA
ncbi:Dus1p, putative [Perkinsus marinus ATCC 50983]|uniref:Dus1p, putative n=1 Tax=Perkinsus marinus (strain ATCC 50983 / TXsc) TaxID=423536 RepID=C5KL55_PERM5|nr:Dus1p, putative [Perkinsus marinus ATCC 50983]EER14728.1 Dus1p, putative [Perkinsus marinus ATCC 50983]|eukprot:XP_002782932.1 Dus1p, putative [Perkinsus marinus ATCC 50983]